MVEDFEGKLAKYYKNCSACVKTYEEDQFFHGLLKTVSKKMEGEVSLFDIPKLYNPSAVSFYEDPEVIPLYTLCELDPESKAMTVHPIAQAIGEMATCTNLWNSYVHDSANPDNKNPNLIPENDPFGLCGKRITNIAK